MKKSCLTTHALRLSVLGVTMGLSLGTQAADVFQTASMGVGSNWTEAEFWTNAETPSAGNDYINANDDNGINQYRWGTRTPTGSDNYIFPGDSLTFTNGGYLNIKGSGIHTFSNMTVWCSETIAGEIENGGADGATIAGILKWQGTGTAKLDAQGSNRMTTIAALMTVDAGIDTVSVLMEQSPPVSTGYILSGFNLTNPDNTFAGLWDVQQGILKGSGFGTGSFKVGAYGTLDFDAEYNNPSADLTIATGGTLLLDQFITVNTATINFKGLSPKTWTAAELIADPTIGSAIDPSSTGSLTILTGPPPVPTETVYQTATMTPGIDWNNAGYWDNAAMPSSDYFYANNTAGWITQTPINSSTFNGYSLAIQNGASLNLQGAATYAVSTLELEAGGAITRSSTGAALLNGILDLTGAGTVTFNAQSTNSMTTIASSLVLTNGSISTIVIDMTDGTVTNTVDAQLSGFIFPVKSDFSGLWQVNGGLLKGIGFGAGSFLVTDFGRLDFDAPYYNLGADLTIEASVVDSSQGGTIVLDQTVNVGTATIWGESLAPGLYTGAELKTNAIYGAAFSGALTLDTAILAVGVPAPINQVANASPSSLGWTDTNSWENAEAPTNLYHYVNSTSGQTIRNPSSGDQVFGGKSLTLSNGAQLKLQNNQSVTITNLTMHASTEIRTVGNTTLNGDLTLAGIGEIVCDVENIRTLTINSLVTAADTITNIIITASQADVTGMVAGVTFTDPANTFGGTWIVEEGYLKGAGLGQGSFLIQETGYLDLDADFNNTNATLVVEVNPTNSTVGGTFLLDQNVTLGDVYLYGVALADGTYTAAELIADSAYGNAIDPASTGTLSVNTSPLPEIGLVSYVMVGTDLVMGWEGSSRASYTVQTKQDLVFDSDWIDEPGYIGIPGIDGPMSVTNSSAIDPTKFYRIIGDK